MKPVLLGVISKNLCIKKASSTSSTISFSNKGGNYDDIEFFDNLDISSSSSVRALKEQTNKKFHLERAILVNGEMAISLTCTESTEVIKHSLLKKYITDAKDFEIAAGIRIPRGFTEKIHFPFKIHPVTINVLPILATFGTESSVSVPWTIYIPNSQNQLVIEAPNTMNYIDFLLSYAAKHQARIDYSIFIYSKPLIFGQATLIYHKEHGSDVSNGSNASGFFFARILSCKELIEQKLVSL